MSGMVSLRLEYLMNAWTGEAGSRQIGVSLRQAPAITNELSAAADLIEMFFPQKLKPMQLSLCGDFECLSR